MHMTEDAKRIIDDSIRAVLPDAAVYRALEGRRFDRPVTVIAIGKAAWRMANAAAKALGENLREGLVITKYGHSEGDIPRMTIYEAAHPIPDEAGVAATRAALALADRMTAQDEVIFLVSGGGSALFEQPLEGVTLDDCAEITRQLLACGADIVQINTIRKHLSAVKGGRFAQRCAPAHVLAIVLSDVLGDSLDSIASGPCYPDCSTCRDVEQLIERYHLVIPPHVLPALQTETPKQLHNVETQITGNVRALCDAAKASAEALGYRTLTLTTTLNCEAREAGAMLASVAREIRQSGQPLGAPCAVILGGETVVHLRGKGKGGRNQELAVAAAAGIDGLPNTLIFSVGSDGTDGPTDAAGGLVTGEFAARCREKGLSIEKTLADNDAYNLLRQTDGKHRGCIRYAEAHHQQLDLGDMGFQSADIFLVQTGIGAHDVPINILLSGRGQDQGQAAAAGYDPYQLAVGDLLVQRCLQLRAEGVAADHAGQRHRSAHPRGGYCLIVAVSAGRKREGVRVALAAGLLRVLLLQDQVHIQIGDHKNITGTHFIEPLFTSLGATSCSGASVSPRSR